MTLCDLYADGFRIITETRRPVDERGIDGAVILKIANRSNDGRNGYKFWVAAHYQKQNSYGAPVPIPEVA